MKIYPSKITGTGMTIILLLLSATVDLHAQSAVTAPLSERKYTTWREQVAYMQELAKTCETEIVFKSYRYAGKIRSGKHKERILDRIFADNAPMIFTVVNLPPKRNEQLIVPCRFIDKIMKALSNEDKEAIAELRRYVNGLIGDMRNTEIIYLKWSYRGNTYRSIAIADDTRGGILYDSIAIYAIAYTKRETIEAPLIYDNQPHKSLAAITNITELKTIL